MSNQPVHFRVTAHKPFIWALIAFVTLFAAGFLLSGIYRQSHAPAREWGGLILAGLALLLLAERIWRYYFLPQITITETQMVLRPFLWPTRRWRYSRTRSWQLDTRRIEQDWRGRPLPEPLIIERLIRTDLAGRTQSAVLPGFAGHNTRLLQALETHSGIRIETAPPGAT